MIDPWIQAKYLWITKHYWKRGRIFGCKQLGLHEPGVYCEHAWSECIGRERNRFNLPLVCANRLCIQLESLADTTQVSGEMNWAAIFPFDFTSGLCKLLVYWMVPKNAKENGIMTIIKIQHTWLALLPPKKTIQSSACSGWWKSSRCKRSCSQRSSMGQHTDRSQKRPHIWPAC